MYGTDENGKKWGKNYAFVTLTDSSMTCLPVEAPIPNGWQETDGIMEQTEGLHGYYYSEPNIVTKGPSINDDGTVGEKAENIYDMDSKNLAILGLSTSKEFLTQMEEEFNNMIASVEKYHGFLSAGSKDNIFSLDILLPVPK